jgi:hypothetical protein
MLPPSKLFTPPVNTLPGQFADATWGGNRFGPSAQRKKLVDSETFSGNAPGFDQTGMFTEMFRFWRLTVSMECRSNGIPEGAPGLTCASARPAAKRTNIAQSDAPATIRAMILPPDQMNMRIYTSIATDAPDARNRGSCREESRQESFKDSLKAKSLCRITAAD